MAAAAFNPLEYAHRLEKAGMPQKLAEVQAQAQFEIIHSLVEDHAVTKEDIKDFKHEATRNANTLRQEMTENTNSLRQEISDNTNITSRNK